MKQWLVFILALVVMAGSVVPCCTEDDCQNEITHADFGGTPQEKGPCSPFFACATCAGFAFVSRQVDLPLPIAQSGSHHEKLVILFSSAYYPSFFQPPRFS